MALVGLVLVGCGGRGEAQSDAQVQELAHELLPRIERAAGLSFKQPPAIAIRDADAVRSYLVHKLDDEYPADEFGHLVTAYRLFGLLPDTVDLRALLVDLYTEQVRGYYDPDSATLYVVAGAPAGELRATLAHELVHALQGQHVPLDSLLSLRGRNDQRMAVQAVMEGQAMLATLLALDPSLDVGAIPDLWRTVRERVRAQQERMPVLAAAPRVIREGLLFPYLDGMDFVRWFVTAHGDTVPFGPRLPASTEQILHPDRYQRGDVPVALAFQDDGALLYEDGLGEFETRILLVELTGSEAAAAAAAGDWGGDRYGLFPAPNGGTALVWWTVWDSERAADRFARLMTQAWPRQGAPGRRRQVDGVALNGRTAVRVMDAPEVWSGWENPPTVRRR